MKQWDLLLFAYLFIGSENLNNIGGEESKLIRRSGAPGIKAIIEKSNYMV